MVQTGSVSLEVSAVMSRNLRGEPHVFTGFFFHHRGARGSRNGAVTSPTNTSGCCGDTQQAVNSVSRIQITKLYPQNEDPLVLDFYSSEENVLSLFLRKL